MKLLTKEIKDKLPRIYGTEGVKFRNKVAQVKFFNPTGAGTWYGIEYDPEEKLFFGYIELLDSEFGYFSLEELESVVLPYRMKIERDLHFTPKKMGEIYSDGRFNY